MEKIACIGAGSMAESIIEGILGRGLVSPASLFVTNKQDQQRLQYLQEKYGVQTTYDLEGILKEAQCIILAMKPKDAHEALETIKPYVQRTSVIISVLAGIPINTIEKILGEEFKIVRAMPNTSAAIGKSATAIAHNQRVSEDEVKNVVQLFSSIGVTAVVDEEKLDAITGLSGSGPAYIYYIVEAFEQSAKELGLDEEIAKTFIIQTLMGAGEMLNQTKKEPADLRKAVTSPGGTTEAGLKVLESLHVKEALVSCVKEATRQSKKLGKEYVK
ncbi:MAG TPA: pyrroline-5-carboxylate reductase [Bacillus sp. (in: firmicutes)]|uniref:pyrroline-5-carboxylate reductase n=1 Tax=Bacillus litorisediminis TaxID=2922713 RepID=UPI001FAD74EA|nr:pyrroline-5-carboxylate reductase [Bacillus litorisediminis]HWO75748.1 pyrroline-5-carboxylate reductase [Bacillus sp. (in: firmicutes)]